MSSIPSTTNKGFCLRLFDVHRAKIEFSNELQWYRRNPDYSANMQRAIRYLATAMNLSVVENGKELTSEQLWRCQHELTIAKRSFLEFRVECKKRNQLPQNPDESTVRIWNATYDTEEKLKRSTEQ